MAIDKRLQIKDEQGNLVDYDILASDVKFLPDGKDLPTKLAEMQDEIDDAGSGGGTVTGVKVGSTTYEPTDGVVDLSSPMGNKVDKNGTDSLMTAAEHTKLGNLPTATELATQMNAKANDNAVVKTISVNGGTPATPVNGNVNIIVEEASQIDPATAAPVMDGTAAVGASTKYAREDHVHPHDTSKQDALTFDNAPTANSNNPVKSGGIKTAIDNLLSNITIGQNGHWYVGSTDTGIQAQGPKGNSVADGETFDIVNNLTDGGESDALSAEMGKQLYIRVYNICNAIVEALRNVAYIGTNGGTLVNNIIVAMNSQSQTVPVEQITLNNNSLTMNVGDTETLQATVLPAIATNKQVVWSSSNNTIATVNAGVVTALQEGTVTISATAADGSGVSASCNISVQVSHVLYSLENEVFDGDKSIDTGIAMYENYSQGDPIPAYSILFDAELPENFYLQSNKYDLFHMLEETSPWPGVCCQVKTTASFGIDAFGKVALAQVLDLHMKVAVVFTSDGYFDVYRFANGAATRVTHETITIVAVNKNLLIGSYQQSNGTLGRYWKGTVHKLAVIDYAVDQSFIEDFFSE